MTQEEQKIIAALQRPFPADDIEWRVQSQWMKSNGEPCATILAYVTARGVMDRLDEVFGPSGWRDEYREWQGTSVLCTLTCTMNGVEVSKQDVAENTNVEAVKGGVSGALKRAAVKWGIGRYLYNIGDSYAVFNPHGKYRTKIDGKTYKWNPPELPDWALPSAKGRSTSKKPDKTPSTPLRETQINGSVEEGKTSAPDKEENLRDLIGEIAILQTQTNQSPQQEKKMLEHYKVDDINMLTLEQAKHCVGVLREKLNSKKPGSPNK